MQVISKDQFTVEADVRGLTIYNEDEQKLKISVSEIDSVVDLIDCVMGMELLKVKPVGAGEGKFRINFDLADEPVLTAIDREGIVPFKFTEGDALITILKMGFDSITNQRKFGNASGNVLPGVELSGEPFI